jgi:hypothetical protein
MPVADGSRNTNQNSGEGSRKCPVITLKLTIISSNEITQRPVPNGMATA